VACVAFMACKHYVHDAFGTYGVCGLMTWSVMGVTGLVIRRMMSCIYRCISTLYIFPLFGPGSINSRP
jgi:hypothetical protein